MAGKPNTSRYAVLGALSLGPRSGYDVKKLIEQSIAHFWSESFGQIYPVLGQLAAEGLAESRTERQAGKPDRQVYSVTPKGLETLREWVTAPARRGTFRSELLLKLFLGSAVPVEDSVRQVERFRAEQESLFGVYRETEKRLRRSAHPDRAYWLMTLSYGKRHTAASIAWCDDTLRALSRLRGAKPARRRGGRR